MVFWILFGGLILATLINWYAAFFERRKRFAATKPSVMILLISIFLYLGGLERLTIWFFLALIFSLAGDIFLLFSKRFFLYGLFVFLCAQISYLIGFNSSFPPLVPSVIGLGLAFIFPLLFYFQLKHEVQTKNHVKRLLPGILIYVFTLSAMTISAGLDVFKPAWNPLAAWTTFVGGFLFLCSDLMLAIDRFIKRFKLAHGLVMVTYHLAQFALVLGVLLQYRILSREITILTFIRPLIK
ncbi:MAG: lysoplasmalogenase [Anaerolineaceae bacterium]|nr:lysoplasmalogenase [Anaerolineaceae bacterium]